LDSSFAKEIIVGARSSPLSRVQVEEVFSLLKIHHPDVCFKAQWFQTSGDLDQKTSLYSMEKTDFFTKEIDEAVLKGQCRIGIHSGKDLPDPLPKGLKLVACTQGINPSDVVVLRDGESLETLKVGAKVGTSSFRREKNIKEVRSDLLCMDIRGPIERRLALLDSGEVDALIMAKAALIRLKIFKNEIELPGEVCPMQGRLAVVAQENDREIESLFSCIHSP